jgi:GT2 family glycosyltransferase
MIVERKPIPVVIPYYKNKNELSKCLAALEKQAGVTTEIYVRDNSEDNILYTRAVNEGLRKFAFSSDFDFILVLTQDAFLKETALGELVSALEKDASIGIASPIQVGENGKITWAGSLRAYPWGVHNLDPASNDAPFSTFWNNGACFLLRISMIREIGLLDDNMLFICSDCDYSFTARARGWGTYVVPTAVCEHYLKASGGTASPEINAVKLADQLYFASKWLNGGLYKSMAYEGRALSSLTVKREFANSLDALRRYQHHFEKFTKPKLDHRTLSILKDELLTADKSGRLKPIFK